MKKMLKKMNGSVNWTAWTLLGAVFVAVGMTTSHLQLEYPVMGFLYPVIHKVSNIFIAVLLAVWADKLMFPDPTAKTEPVVRAAIAVRRALIVVACVLGVSMGI